MKLYFQIYIVFILTVSAVTMAFTVTENCTSKVYAQERTTKEYHIVQDGTGDFITIQEGVDYAKNGDTLIIYPGIYNENVSVLGKELHLEGVDKDTCIVQYDSADYRNSPLVIAAGSISNLTIIGVDTDIDSAVPTEKELEQITPYFRNYNGYTVHIDQNFLSQREIKFSNCNMISQYNYCVGIGSRSRCKIIFENCNLTAIGIGGCILLHDTDNEQLAGEADLIMRNCNMKCYRNPYIMAFQSLSPSNRFNLTFQNVKTSTIAYSIDAVYQDYNVNTSYTVEELVAFEKSNILNNLGLTLSTKKQLVHVLSPEASTQYMSRLQLLNDTKDYSNIMAIDLPEGIIYINEKIDAIPRLKHQVIDIENYSGQPENGWCGLQNAYLTPDSYGNTLAEMNANS